MRRAGQPGEAATSHEPKKKITRQRRYTRRRPAISDTFPMNVMLTAYDTKYPVTTQPAMSSFWISIFSDAITSGSTADTMVRSSAPMKTGRQTSARTKPRVPLRSRHSGLRLGRGGGAAASECRPGR